MKKITFATTCMGRKHHLMETLPANLAMNTYPNAEFLILDYNSSDGLDEWIRENWADRLGKDINYYAERSREFFFMAHAKNLAASLAEGDIVVNLDADRFIDPHLGFQTIDALAEDHTVARARILKHSPDWSAYGLIACHRKDFCAIGGYDEQMSYGWGYEDHDFVYRAIALGYRFAWLETSGRSLEHPDMTRNDRARNRLSSHLSESQHRQIHRASMIAKRYVANANRIAGEATVVRNFSEVVKSRIV